MWIEVEQRPTVEWEDVKTMMRWARAGKRVKSVTLQQLYEWDRLVRYCPGGMRGFVRKRVDHSIRKLGGVVAPTMVLFRVEAGVTMSRGDLRREWCRLVDDEQGRESSSDGITRRKKDALMIVQGKGETVGGLLVNAPMMCNSMRMQGGMERCACEHYPELIGIMKSQCSEAYAASPHIHMPLRMVPWSERDIANVNMKSTVGGISENGKAKMVTQLQRMVAMCIRGSKQRARHVSEIASRVRMGVPTKRLGRSYVKSRVLALKAKCAKGCGLMVSVMDRDEGQGMITCPARNDAQLRDHFKHCETIDEWRSRGEADGVKYWKVNRAEEEVLREWRDQYMKWNKRLAKGRWMEWDPKGRMSRARNQYKKKNLLKVRLIYNSKRDPCRREMQVVTKVLNLVSRTVNLHDFSLSSGMQLDGWLESTEQEMLRVYGQHTRLKIASDDFKDYFPSNSKAAVVGHFEELIEMLMGDGDITAGCRRPRNEWCSVPLRGKEVARWGKSNEKGWVSRKLRDVVHFLRFREEVANLFAVGDTILGAKEVIIGEGPSPELCNIGAKLCEYKLRQVVPGLGVVCRAKRYVDDGIKMMAYKQQDGEHPDVETMRLVDGVRDTIAAGYPGITVTDEGTADRDGGEIDFLEYTIGVCSGGRRLWWRFNNKNIETILSTGRQGFKRLMAWDCGANTRSLLQVVRTKLESIVAMTRMDKLWVGGPAGSGDIVRDVTVAVLEMCIELVWCLGYPVAKLYRLIQGMRLRSALWYRVKVELRWIQDMKDEYQRVARGLM